MTRSRTPSVALALSALLAAISSCGGDAAPAAKGAAEGAGAGGAEAAQVVYDTEIPTVTYAWDPDAGDPSVPAELGGPGFTGEGWETNMTFPAMGVAGAPQGGELSISRPDWPATLRMAGKDWNTDLTYQIRDMCYESLLWMHPTTLEYIPKLATHWQISDDKMTYRFRINPEARFSNGEEVTAHDVVASYKLRIDPTLLDPSSITTFEKMYEPVAVSKYIVEVKCREENWRNFLYISGAALPIFPASQISISGKEYLDEYQFDFVAGSGPYHVLDEDVVMGQSVRVSRRADWWDADNPAWAGLFNIGAYKYVVVQDNNLEYEKLKAGEIDYFVITKAQWFAEDLPQSEPARRGLIQRCKVFNDAPKVLAGIAINMKRPPLDDRRVRLALAHLYPRRQLIEKFMFDEYLPLASYWPGSSYANPDNEPVEYDEFRAVELLEEAGWTEVDAEGYRVKDGRRLQFDLTYSSQGFERYFTVYQERCRAAGVQLELQYLTPASRWKNMRQKEYDLTSTAWGGLVIPNPESSWLGEYADGVNTNNVVGFSDPRVDELLREYDREYDPARRIEIVQEIDGIVFEAHPYVLGWGLPCERVVFWNKIGMPKWGANRTWDDKYMHYSWWIDPEKEAQLERAAKDPSVTMETLPVENHFWAAWKQVHQN